MKIYMRNAEEYVGVLLGLCGELEKGDLLGKAPLAPASTYRAIKNLKDKGVLIRHKYDDGKTYYRLSSKNASSYLAGVTPALLGHAKQIVNEDLKYSGAKSVRLRDRANYDLYLSMLKAGIPVNELCYEYIPKELFEQDGGPKTSGESIFLEDGSPLGFEQIAKTIGKNYTGFFTKKIIKEKHQGEVTNKSSRTSRISGSLFLNSKLYQVYALLDPQGSSWKTEAEIGGASYILGTLKKESPYFRDSNLRIENMCILSFASIEHAEKMLLPPEGRAIQIDPCAIYEKSFVRPELSLSTGIRHLLENPNLQGEVLNQIFPGCSSRGVADGVLPDGTEAYSFLGCDLNKIRSVTPRIASGNAKTLLLVEEWMSDVSHKAFDRPSLEIVAISDSDINTITSSLLP